MAYQVVLDADVIFPASLRDTLLRLAEIELFDPRWSDRILAEAKRNVVQSRAGVSAADMDRMAATMNAAFEDALVDQAAIARIEGAADLALALAGRSRGEVGAAPRARRCAARRRVLARRARSA